MIIADPHFLKTEGLSIGMVTALKDVYIKQKIKKPLSLRDISGSRSALLNRDLIELSTVFINRLEVTSWKLSKKGMQIVKYLNLES